MRYSFSIVIPVLNEASIINHTIEHLYRIRSDFDVEVIVVDGDPRGATLSAIHHKDVIKVLSLRGRGTQMNKGASVSKGEIVTVPAYRYRASRRRFFYHHFLHAERRLCWRSV